MRIEKNGRVITSIDDWKQYAPPKRPDAQWDPGRSAYELAQAWCDSAPAMPPALLALLDSRVQTAGMAVDCVFPEYQIRFDDHGGEPRNADLAFLGRCGDRTVAVTIEAKADEKFGETIAKTACAALERRISNPHSQGIERLVDLTRSLLPPWTKGQPHLYGLYYQLLTATAGTLAYAVANKASLAVLVVHEFVTDKTTDSKHARNAEAYRDYLDRLCPAVTRSADAQSLLGPFPVPGRPLFDQPPPLLIGKITTNRRQEISGRPATVQA